MNRDTIIAALNKADPERNSNYQDRHVALEFAHRAMDAQGLSYSSLGYSQEDAERIENQFSATIGHAGNGSGHSRTGYQWWNPFTWGEETQEENNTETKQNVRREKRYNDGNGCEYNPKAGDWEYADDADGNANPNQCNYEAPQDYQGSVSYWDGYSGET